MGRKSKGRLKNFRYAKNRVHSVILTEGADFLYRTLCKEKGVTWLGKYLSEHLLRDFKMDVEGFLKFKMVGLQLERDDYNLKKEIELRALALQLQEMRFSKEIKEAEMILGPQK